MIKSGVYKSLLILVCLIIFGCNSSKNEPLSVNEENNSFSFDFAKGLTVISQGDFYEVEVSNAWPDSEKTYKYAFINREKAAKTTFPRDQYDAIILTPVERIITTSTTHLPALEALGSADKLIGFPGTDYISSETFRKQVENGSIRELGKNEGLNTEVILELNPDVVIGFSVDGVNRSFETLGKAGIQVVYNGDWVEDSPLAKAEWVKFFGLLLEKEKKADSIFETIKDDYLAAAELAKGVSNKPTVLSGAMHKDVWYLPGGESPEAQFLKDANVDYLWQDTSENGSLSLSFEAVFDKAREAEIWLNPSYYSSFEDLEQASSLYTEFDAFKNKSVYSFTNTRGPSGGILYYELGISRPDLVLKDIIKICHPNVLPDYESFFIKPLD